MVTASSGEQRQFYGECARFGGDARDRRIDRPVVRQVKQPVDAHEWREFLLASARNGGRRRVVPHQLQRSAYQAPPGHAGDIPSLGADVDELRRKWKGEHDAVDPAKRTFDANRMASRRKAHIANATRIAVHPAGSRAIDLHQVGGPARICPGKCYADAIKRADARHDRQTCAGSDLRGHNGSAVRRAFGVRKQPRAQVTQYLRVRGRRGLRAAHRSTPPVRATALPNPVSASAATSR